MSSCSSPPAITLVSQHESLNLIYATKPRISTKPFLQIARIMREGRAVAADGSDIYLPNPQNLDLPITFIAGALNEEFLPDTSLRTLMWLTEQNPDYAGLYDRKVFQDYGIWIALSGATPTGISFRLLLNA